MRAADGVSAPDGVWLTGKQAEMASGRNVYSVMKAALLGLVRYEARPGESLRYWGPDVSKMAGGR